MPGSNGQDYRSRCHLERDACERRLTNLTVVYRGRCNPCTEVTCKLTEECHVLLTGENKTKRETKCMCNHDCPEVDDHDESKYVCASNGRTV